MDQESKLGNNIRRVQFLKAFSYRPLKLITAHYLKTSLEDPYIKEVQVQFRQESKNIIEILKGWDTKKVAKLAGGKQYEKENPEGYYKKCGEIRNELLGKYSEINSAFNLYEFGIKDDPNCPFHEFDFIETLFPKTYYKIRSEYVKRNAELLNSNGNLLTIPQVLRFLSFIKKEGNDDLGAWRGLADMKPIRKIKSNRRQTIYKWREQGKLRAVKVNLKNRATWTIEKSALLEFCMMESLSVAGVKLAKLTDNFIYRYTFFENGEIEENTIFSSLKVPSEKVHILKLPISEKWKLMKQYPKGKGMALEVKNQCPNFDKPFAVIIGDDDSENLKWLIKEKIADQVVRGSIGKRWISFQEENDWIRELQFYICENVIPSIALQKFKSINDLKKYLKMTARNELVNRLRNSKKNRFLELVDNREYENNDETI